MGFDLEISVPALTVFIQGILSFFSPCVLPLVPLYVGYLAGGAKTVEADGTIRYPRGRVMWNTLFFVLGISATFFLLGFGFTALGQFFSDNRLWFARISGIIMVLFGLYQLGVFGHSMALEAGAQAALPAGRPDHGAAGGPGPGLYLQFRLDPLCRAGAGERAPDGLILGFGPGSGAAHRGVHLGLCAALPSGGLFSGGGLVLLQAGTSRWCAGRGRRGRLC